jgi:hypothetical protein
MGAYLELRRGIGEPSFIPLSAGKELTIGRRGMWRVEAAGVLDVHAYVYFDGASLFVQSHDASAPVRVNGQDVGTDWLPLDRSCDIEIAGAVVGYAAEQAHADAEEATSIYDNAPIAAPARPPPPAAPLPPEQQTVAIAQPAPVPVPVNMRSTMAMDDAPRPAAPSGRPPPRNPNAAPPPPPTGGFAPFPQPPGANRPAEDSGATRLQPLPVPAPSAPAVRPAAGAPLPRMATGPSAVVQIADDPLRSTHFQPAVAPQNPGMMQMQPGMMQPGMMQPGIMQPGTMPPGMMQPGMMPPGMDPGMMQPGMMQPGMMQPGMMQPGMMQPGMMQPGMMQPGMMQPGMMQPGMMQPGMDPGMMQPGLMQPGMMQPGMMQPGMMQPGMMQPGMMQPGMPGAQLPPGAKPSYAEQWKALSIPRKVSILLSPFVLIACIDIFFFDEEPPPVAMHADAGAKRAVDSGSATADAGATIPSTVIEPLPPIVPDAAATIEPPPVQDAGVVPPGPTSNPPKVDAGAGGKPTATDTPPKPPAVRTLERQAADAYAAGRYEEAALLYDQLASQFPNDPTYKEIARIIRRRMSAPPQPR